MSLISARLTSGRDLTLEFATFPLDKEPASANAMDDEFGGTSLDTGKWTWVNQGTRSAAVSNGRLILTHPNGTTDGLGGIYQSTPTAPWCFRAKLLHHTGQHQVNTESMLFVGESTTGELTGLGGFQKDLRGSQHLTPTSGQSGWGATLYTWIQDPYYVYVQFIFDGNDLCGYVSYGAGWYRMNRDAIGYTPAIVGLGTMNSGSVYAHSSWEWFRRIF